MALLASTLALVSSLLANSLLAAEASFLGSPTARVVAWIIGLFVVLGIAWGASIFFGSRKIKKRDKKVSAAKNSESVFDEICTAQGLSLNEKRRLLDGAATLKLDSPAFLFVDSGLLNELAASESEDASEFRKLADRLFPSNSVPDEAEPVETSAATATVTA